MCWNATPLKLYLGWRICVRTAILIFIASSTAFRILGFFRRLGLIGLFLLGVLDSSFLVLPFGNDFLLIALVSSNRGPIWILYVLISALGSMAGVCIVDLIMRKAGEEGLERFVKKKRVEQLQQKMDKGVGWVVFTSALLPPPFPFTAVVMTASALQCSRGKMYLGVFVGRLLRFTLEALLAIYFGRQVLRFLDSPVLDYFVYALVAIGIIGSVLSLMKWLHRSKQEDKQTEKTTEPSAEASKGSTEVSAAPSTR
jgi:membrane protein YqaA with SNARE-associated domain